MCFEMFLEFRNNFYPKNVMKSKQNSSTCAFFFRGSCGGIVVYLVSMVSFFASTCPIRSGVGAIDNPDQPGQVFEQYDISEVPEKISRTTFRWLVVRKSSFLVISRLV